MSKPFEELLAAMPPESRRRIETSAVEEVKRQELIYDANDDGNAEAFADTFRDDVRYDHTRKRWLIWKKHWWQQDADATVLRLAANLIKKRYQRAWDIADPKLAGMQAKFMQRSRDERRLKSCLALAGSKKPLASDGKEWDADPWLLGVANGVIDLRTGVLREGQPDDNVTKHSLAEFNPKAKCPRWERFLEEIFIKGNGQPDYELIEFVHRAVGYSLTGHVSEQVWFFCEGTGRNGKSTFLNTLQRILGEDYARSLPFDELTQKKFGHSHPVGLYHLEGSRFVVAVEGAKQAAFDDQRLKLLTGGEKIVARGMRENFHEFIPTFKVWLAANHQLQVNDRTEGFWRRIRIVPFHAKFEGERADRHLEATLTEELPGILAWAVRGALHWQQKQLKPPACVTEAIDEYRSESDVYAGFFNERCIFEQGAFTSNADLVQSFSEWRTANPEAPAMGAAFYDSLREHGARNHRTTTRDRQVQRGYRGLRLIDPTKEEYAKLRSQAGEDYFPSYDAYQDYKEWTASLEAEAVMTDDDGSTI